MANLKEIEGDFSAFSANPNGLSVDSLYSLEDRLQSRVNASRKAYNATFALFSTLAGTELGLNLAYLTDRTVVNPALEFVAFPFVVASFVGLVLLDQKNLHAENMLRNVKNFKQKDYKQLRVQV